LKKVTTGDLKEIQSWLDAGCKFYVAHIERNPGKGFRYKLEDLRPVNLKIFEGRALTYEGFGGTPYSHYEGTCVWARREGHEHVICLWYVKLSFV
jgi:hypothetical protein